MVIKKDPKTGKYYIAPSPPSFYESKPSSPSSPTSIHPKAKPGETREELNQRLVEEMRQRGIAQLNKDIQNTLTGKKSSTSRSIINDILVNEMRRRGSVAINEEIKKIRSGQKGKISQSIINDILVNRMREQGKLSIKNFPGLTRDTAESKAFLNRYLRERMLEQGKKQLAAQGKDIIGFNTAKIKNIMDIATGGYLTERKLDKQEEKLYQDIEEFNKQFGGKELTDAEYNRAKKIYNSIQEREKEISKEKDKLALSFRSKVIDKYLFKESPMQQRLTQKEKQEIVKKNQPKIKKQEEELKKLEEKITNLKNKKGFVATLERKRLKNMKSGIEEELTRLKEAKPSRMYAGTFPVIPAVNIPSGVTQIKFIGEQKIGKSGKIITDIAFRTSSGEIGVAKGVSVSKGKEGASVFLGRSGKRVFSFPTGKEKIINLRSFIGREKTIAKPTEIFLRNNVELLKSSKGKSTVLEIKKALKVLQQKGVGQVGSIAGKKFFKGGKLLKGISYDDFASVSAVLTKKDLSLIVGKSITGIGAKSKFIGLIKGVTKDGKKFVLNSKEQQQYAKALKKVVSTVASAVSKTKATGTAPKLTSIVEAANLVKLEAAGKITKPKLKQVKKFKPQKITTKKVEQIQIQKPKVVTKQEVKISTRSKISQRQAITPKQKQKSKQKQKQAQKTGQKSKSRQKQKQRVKLSARQVQRQSPLFKPKPTLKITRVPRIPRGIIPKIQKKKVKKKAAVKSKKEQAYNVYARPLKKTKKGKQPKLVKVNDVPLSKEDAEDLRNYIDDTSLSRTAKASKTKGTPKKSKLKFPKGYAKKTANKFRNYKIVKGRRVKLPKGTVIEKRTHLLDTAQEKRKISLRKRISQIKPKTVKRKVSRTITRKPIRIKKPIRKSSIKKTINNPIKRTKRRPVKRSVTKINTTVKRTKIPKQKRWIQKTGMKKGALSKRLGIPEKKNIPITLLNKIIKAKPGQTIRNPTKTGKRKIKVTRDLERKSILAKNLKNISKKRKR